MKCVSGDLAQGRPVSPPTFDDAYPIVRRVAGSRAAVIAKSYGLSYDERADLVQDAALEMWKKLHAFDASRSSLKTFIERVISSQITSFLRKRAASKRRSLAADATIDRTSPDMDCLNLRVDVCRVLERLPDKQRQIGLMLSDFSPSEVSRQTGMSRASLYRAIGRIRVRFVEAGFAGSGRVERPSRNSLHCSCQDKSR